MLQWGRNILVTEIGQDGLEIIVFYKLQWGRNILVTEIKYKRGLKAASTAASMGP